MLLSEAAKYHKPWPDYETAYFQVPWSSYPIRFHEKLQLIDVADCFYVLYSTAGSAKTAQTKVFGATNLKTTAEGVECSPDEFLYRIKWSDSARTRLAVRVKHMQTIVSYHCAHAPQSKKLASMINVDTLTVAGIGASINAKCLPTGELSDVECSTLMSLGESTHAKSRMEYQMYSSTMLAETAEQDTRRMVEIQKKEHSRLDSLHDKALRTFERCNTGFLNQLRCDETSKLAVAESGIEYLKIKIKAAEELGMIEEVKQLKREFMDMDTRCDVNSIVLDEDTLERKKKQFRDEYESVVNGFAYEGKNKEPVIEELSSNSGKKCASMTYAATAPPVWPAQLVFPPTAPLMWHPHTGL